MTEVYHYGCVERVGHFLRGPGPSLRDAYDMERELDRAFDTYDLAPGRREYGNHVRSEDQVEGHATIKHAGGWTAMSFWDRSVDVRHGSVSTFFARGTYGPAAMLDVCRRAFPMVWERFKFEVRVVERAADEVLNVPVACAACGGRGYLARLGNWQAEPAGWFLNDAGGQRACSVACVTAMQVGPK